MRLGWTMSSETYNAGGRGDKHVDMCVSQSEVEEEY
jgi:hypothetical protein